MAGKLLVVDDLAANRKLLCRLLQGHGFVVETAANGEAALLALQRGGIDTVLLDVDMPGLNGVEVLQVMSQHPMWRNIPVVMVSGCGDPATVRRCLDLGAVEFLAKPVPAERLLACVQSCVARHAASGKFAL